MNPNRIEAAASARLSALQRETAGSGGAARAVAGWRIGIDLEQRGAVAPGQAGQFATASERLACGGDVTALWCLKEAAWKAFGRGVALPADGGAGRPGAFELVFEDSRVAAVRVGGAAVAVQSSVRELRDGWVVATVAVRERDVARLRSRSRSDAQEAAGWRRAHGA